MTNPQPSTPLPRDLLRTIVAAALASLGIGGWAFALLQPDMRASLGAQGGLWWVQQLVTLGQTILCLGIVLEWPAAARAGLPATALVLVLGAIQWVQEATRAQVSVPITGILNALLLWRLITVRPVARASGDAPAA